MNFYRLDLYGKDFLGEHATSGRIPELPAMHDYLEGLRLVRDTLRGFVNRLEGVHDYFRESRVPTGSDPRLREVGLVVFDDEHVGTLCSTTEDGRIILGKLEKALD